LQNEAKADTLLSDHDLIRFKNMLIDQGLGGSYHLGYVADKLSKLGLDLSQTPESLEYGFFRRLVRVAMQVSLLLLTVR
jgi:hypothetical protein